MFIKRLIANNEFANTIAEICSNVPVLGTLLVLFLMLAVLWGITIAYLVLKTVTFKFVVIAGIALVVAYLLSRWIGKQYKEM